MTSHSLQASSHCLQAPFVSGAPGPPAFRPTACLIKEDDDEEMFYPAPGRGEPDDLGELMQEMREGAWVEGLAMDGCVGDLPAAAASPYGAPASGAAPDEAPLQASLAAQLMHPRGGAGGAGAGGAPLAMPPGGHMIPVALPGAGCEGESEPAAGCGGPAAAGWLPPPVPYSYCAHGMPAPAPDATAAAAAAAAAMQQAAGFFCAPPPAGSPSLAAFQTAPPSLPHAHGGALHAAYDVGRLLGCGPYQTMMPTGASGRSSTSGDTKAFLRASLGGGGGSGSAGDSGSGGGGATVPQLRGLERSGSAGGPGGSCSCDAPSESSDVEDGSGGARRMRRQPSAAQVVPDLGSPPAWGLLLPPCLDSGAFPPFPPMPPPMDLGTPAAQTARAARQASLARYRAKKARRGFAKKIRYVARKVNADKRPRVKGRFVKADEGAAILAAAAASATAAAGSSPGSPCCLSAERSAGSAFCA